MHDHNERNERKRERAEMRMAVHWHRRFFRLARRVGPDISIVRTGNGLVVVTVTVPSCWQVYGFLIHTVPSATVQCMIDADSADHVLLRVMYNNLRRALIAQGRDER